MTPNDEQVAEMPTTAAATVREMCARAMVQPDMAEVERLLYAREAAGYAAGVTSGAKQMFDYIQFAAANTSDIEWDTRLCELSQDALEAVSPAAHTEWKTIQRVASESRTAGEAAGYARGLAACQDALADACCAAEIPDSKYESLMIALHREVKP